MVSERVKSHSDVIWETGQHSLSQLDCCIWTRRSVLYWNEAAFSLFGIVLDWSGLPRQWNTSTILSHLYKKCANYARFSYGHLSDFSAGNMEKSLCLWFQGSILPRSPQPYKWMYRSLFVLNILFHWMIEGFQPGVDKPWTTDINWRQIDVCYNNFA